MDREVEAKQEIRSHVNQLQEVNITGSLVTYRFPGDNLHVEKDAVAVSTIEDSVTNEHQNIKCLIVFVLHWIVFDLLVQCHELQIKYEPWICR